MKRLIALFAGFGILVFGFQNCSQNSVDTTAQFVVPSSTQTKIEDPDLKVAKSIDILTQSADEKISLDLVTGKILQVTSSSSVEKCLSDSMRAMIQDLIQNSSLCEFRPAQNQLCAHVYVHPYADIHWDEKSVSVGENMSSCHKGPDLCGQDGKILQGLLRDVIGRWDEWSCDFRVL